MTLQQLQAKIKAASDKMRSDDNTKNALRYLEQLTWLLFLKQYETLEDEQALIAEVEGREYRRVVDGEYRWSNWVGGDKTGDALIKWVTENLLPHLRGLSGDSRSEQVARLFQPLSTVMKSGYALKEVAKIVDGIEFDVADDFHSMSVIYETLLAQTADAGWSGEFYTPRPVVEFMVDVVKPKIGETIYDPCHGSAGFLVAAADRMHDQVETTAHEEHLATKAIYGQEAGDLAYFVGTMNLMLHKVTNPQTFRRNTLEQDVRNIPASARHDVILTNPPFGGSENPQVQQNFPIKVAATEMLFLQHCMAKMATDGRCAIVVPDGVLYRADQAYNLIRRKLMKDFGITAVVRLATGVFQTAPDIRTNVLFFQRGVEQPETIRYYQVPPPSGKRSYSKTNPITRDHLEGAFNWVEHGAPDDYSWEVSFDEVKQAGWTLDFAWPGSLELDDGADAPERLAELTNHAEIVRDIARELVSLSEQLDQFATEPACVLGPSIRETGERAGDEVPDKFVGVSNEGGIQPFKGKPSEDTSRYRRLEVGDFVYNPMRVNVGSIALCKRREDAGWVSPEYVVFRLTSEAPFSADYLLTYLKSDAGRSQIVKHSRGAVRRRLYYEDLTKVEVPMPADGEAWESLLQALASTRRHVRELPPLTAKGLGALERALFARSQP